MKNLDTTPLIQLQGVSKSYKTPSGDIEVLHNVSCNINSGSFTIIYGPSGSGKSTLLNILIGLDAPTNGSISYDNQDLSTMTKDQLAYFRAHTMGMVQQTNHWIQSLSVLDNVSMPLYFLGASTAEASAGARKSLLDVGMESHLHKYPGVLSGGEQQRVAMARALVNEPAYIAADEPTGNLDSKNGDDLINLLQSLNKQQGRTIILVTHNLEYLSLADTLLLIEDGHVTETKGRHIHDVTSRLLTDTRQRINKWMDYEKK